MRIITAPRVSKKPDGAKGKFVDADHGEKRIMSFISNGVYSHLMSLVFLMFLLHAREWPLQLAKDLMPRTSFAQNVAS